MGCRSVCCDVPSRIWVRHWLASHGRSGHGVHSPYLYSLCQDVLKRRRGRVVSVGHGLPRRLRRIACEVDRLFAWSGASFLAVPDEWGIMGRGIVSVGDEGVCGLTVCGQIARGERVVVVMRREEWSLWSKQTWRELSAFFGEESWFVLLGIRAEEGAWQRWKWLSQRTVFTVSIDRWHYGMVVRRSGMASYSFGVR